MASSHMVYECATDLSTNTQIMPQWHSPYHVHRWGQLFVSMVNCKTHRNFCQRGFFLEFGFRFKKLVDPPSDWDKLVKPLWSLGFQIKKVICHFEIFQSYFRVFARKLRAYKIWRRHLHQLLMQNFKNLPFDPQYHIFSNLVNNHSNPSVTFDNS